MGSFGGRKGKGKLYNYTIIPKVNGKKVKSIFLGKTPWAGNVK